MKLSLFVAGLLVAATTALQAAEPFEIPSFLKDLKDLDQAKKEAADSNKGVTFLLMEPGST